MYIYIYCFNIVIFFWVTDSIAQSSGTVEYTDCISAEEKDLPNECPRYDIYQSDGEAQPLEIWGILSTPSLLSLQGPLCSGVVVPDRVLSWVQIERFAI